MTFFGPDQVERVKASADIVRVAERYVTGMKRAGKNYIACCCFHAERTPSLNLYPDEGRYHCFGCGAHGDVISLVQQLDHVGFQEAVARLAKECGIALEDQATGGPKEDHSGLYRACEFATHFYEQQLRSDYGQAGLAYLRDRKLTDDTIGRFRLGWAPGFTMLCEASIREGIHVADLQAAGLAKFKDGKLRDRFYKRIVIPITDSRGRPVAFSCRVLPEDAIAAKQRDLTLPKYVNTDDTPLYHKGRTVFNQYRAKGAALKAERLLVLEGGLDVIAADQAGFPEAVAPCGTALTVDQASLLASLASRHDVFLALDGDDAGKAATAKGARLLLSAGATVRIATLPADTDPAELLVEAPAGDAEATRVSFRELLGRAAQGLRWIVAQAVPDPAIADEPTRLRALDEILDMIRLVKDEDLRDLYAEAAAKQLKVPGSLARKRAQKSRGTSDSSTPGKPHTGVGGSDYVSRYELNETGNAKRFLDTHGDDVRFVHTWGIWLVWMGTHWEIDRTREVERRMTEAIKTTCDEEITNLEAEAERLSIEGLNVTRILDLIDTLTKWRIKNRNDRALINSLSRAASLAELGITDEQLDRDPWSFTVENGTLDLRTGELHKQKREDYITRFCPVPYNPEAVDQRWNDFLTLFTNESDDLAAYLQRSAGYAMSGVTKEDAVWMFAGPGSNGKSTFTAAVQSLLGSYARPLPFELFLSSHSDKRKWSLAETSQCRLVVCEESEEGRRFNASLVKQVTGGTPIEAERKHGTPFSFLPKFKVWFITNNPPTVSDTDHGFWRRLHLVLCEKAPAKPDRDLKPYLQSDPAARAAILAWAVSGAKAYASAGLQAPESVLQANKAYRNEQDPLRPFLLENCILDETAQIPTRDLMAAYDKWADDSKLRTKLSQKAISLRLGALGVQTTDVWVYSSSLRKSIRAYGGIRLRTGEDQHPVDDEGDGSPRMEAATRGDGAKDLPGQSKLPFDGADRPSTEPSVASDQPVASDTHRISGQPEANATTPGDNDLPPVAPGASDQLAHTRARKPIFPLSSNEKEKTGDENSAPEADPMSRGGRLKTKPSADPSDEDPFSDLPPPLREPGADEDEPPYPPDQSTVDT